MKRLKLDYHPSVVVVHCKELDKFLFSVYDESYPMKAYRLSANNIGGNPERGDSSPRSVLTKELYEEFDPNRPEGKKFVGKVLWATREDICLIRDGILENIEPLQDFLVRQSRLIKGGNNPYQAIYSVFYSQISSEVVRVAQKNIQKNLNITTEGILGIYNLGELTNHPKGRFSTAHITAPILNWMFKSKIPYPKQTIAKPIGLPKDSFEDYKRDFRYKLKKGSIS